MKKNIVILTMLVSVLGFLAACKKSAFDDKFQDPEKTTQGTIDALFSGLFKNRRIIPDYWDQYTFKSQVMGMYTQTIGMYIQNKMYEQPTNYTQDYWDDFYAAPGGVNNFTAPLSSYREMEKLYNNLTAPDDKEGYLLFMETGRIFLYDQATQMVDMWGDIPLSTAGGLNTNGVLELATYDNGKDIYDSAFVNLKRINDYLAKVEPQQFYLNKFSKQDVIFRGDLQKWRRYANSLALRLAMHISNTFEDKAKGIALEMLNNPTLYPMVDGVSDNVQVTTGGINTVLDLKKAWEQNHDLAPEYMVDSIMKPSNDPRLRVLYGKNTRGEYQGLPRKLTLIQQDSMVTRNLISRLDSVTFTMNNQFPGIIMTAAEVSFLKAEVAERWGVGLAKLNYEQGIKQSIDYYYQIHNASPYGVKETAPTVADITLLLQNPLVAYGTDNLNKIGLQKWLNFGLMQNNLSWTEIRRSGYPRLTFPADPGTTLVPRPAYRLTYPDKERIYNSKNYASVADKDNVYFKIFWMQ